MATTTSCNTTCAPHLGVDALSHLNAAVFDGDGAVSVVDGHEDVEGPVLPVDAELGGHHGQSSLLPPVGLQCHHTAPRQQLAFVVVAAAFVDVVIYRLGDQCTRY